MQRDNIMASAIAGLQASPLRCDRGGATDAREPWDGMESITEQTECSGGDTDEAYFEKYVDAVYRHMWAEPKKMDEPDVIAAALAESGLPVGAILAGTGCEGLFALS